MSGLDAIVFVAVIAVVMFTPWWVGFPLVLVYNCYVGFRAGRDAKRLKRLREHIAEIEAENKAAIDRMFR